VSFEATSSIEAPSTIMQAPPASPRSHTCGEQLLRRQDGMGEGRPVQVMRRMHHLVAEGGGRVAHQGHVIAGFHREPTG